MSGGRCGGQRVYTSVRNAPELPAGEPAPARVGRRGERAAGRVGGTVVAMGFVSFCTDTSAEMVTAILPVFLVLQIGLTPLAYGVVDGLYQGITVLVRVLGGYAADRWRRPKLVCGVGYGLSAVTKLGLLGVGSAAGTSLLLSIDRTGKGLRTAPRDAIIAASSDPAALGRAFGVHRAMDTAGAMLGPLVAFALLLAVPGSYDSVFVTSFAMAVVGLAVLALFVPDLRWSPPGGAGAARATLRGVGGLLRDRRLLSITAVAGVLALVTVSDGFLYLTLQHKLAASAEVFPLFALGTAAVYLLLAMPFGRLADRVGRRTVFVGGHLGLLGSYLLLLAPVPAPVSCAGALALFGAYYAATDGVLSAAAAELLPGHLRTSGLALVQTAVAGGRLASSLLFGLVWTILGSQAQALGVFTVALVVGLPVAATLLGRGRRRSPEQSGEPAGPEVPADA
jgi:MFS family permease